MTNETLFLRRFMGDDIPEDYVEWAVQLLCEGFDSPSLRILAGLDLKFQRDEIEPYFTETCKELDIDIPPRVQEPRATARLIKNLGKLSAEAVIRMMADLCKKSGYSDPLLQVWFDIEEERSLKGSGHEGCFYPPEKLESLDEVVRQEWDLFVRASRLDLPEKFMRFIRCDKCGYIGKPKLKHKLLLSILGLEYPTCSRCGSFDYHNMIDPEVRDDYFRRLENDTAIDS